MKILSDFLEDLKVYKEGVFLNKTVSIFYNDWSLNPDYEDKYIGNTHWFADRLLRMLKIEEKQEKE